jgi:hypothetical protein
MGAKIMKKNELCALTIEFFIKNTEKVYFSSKYFLLS